MNGKLIRLSIIDVLERTPVECVLEEIEKMEKDEQFFEESDLLKKLKAHFLKLSEDVPP